MKLIITGIFLFFITFAQAQTKDTTVWTAERTLPKKLSDSVGGFETDWVFHKVIDSADARYVIHRQYFKDIKSQVVQVRFRYIKMPAEKPQSAKERFIEFITR